MSGSLRRLAGLVSSASSKIQRAKALMEKGRRAEGFRMLTPLAQAGNAEAEFLVARCYLEGSGVPPSGAEGARWLERAAGQGYLEAQSMLAALRGRVISTSAPYRPGSPVCRRTTQAWRAAWSRSQSFISSRVMSLESRIAQPGGANRVAA